MKVLAAPGINVPMESHPRQYITDTPPAGSDAYEVDASAYYLRRVADGDLIEVAAGGSATKTKEAK